MASPFNIGDVVSLKSGGPRMTVDYIETEDDGTVKVWCVWFDDKREHKSQVFSAETLEK